MVTTPHLDRACERELLAITAAVAHMSDLAERMVRDSVLAVLSRDAVLGRQVVAADAELDALETRIDQQCVCFLARRGPAGATLRHVTATLKLVTDIERMGDLAVNVVKRGLPVDAHIGVPSEVADLARAVVDEVALAFRALRERDAMLARCLRDADRATDERNRAAFDRLVHLGHQEPGRVEAVLALTNVCRNLERMGDHAVNVAEALVFLVEGKVLRHGVDA